MLGIRRSLVIAAAAWCFGSTIIRAETSPALQATFDDKGIASLGFNGVDNPHPADLSIAKLDLRHGFPPAPTQPANNESTESFDAQTHRLTRTYAWGTLSCAYQVDGDHKLMLDIAVHNTSQDSIFGITASPLQLQLPGPVHMKGWAHGWPSPSVLNDAPEILDVTYANGSIAICNEQVERPLYLDLHHAGGDLYDIEFRHDGPLKGQEISAGDSREFSLSVRFGPKRSSSIDLAKDIYQRYAAAYPSELKWDDRRPIGCCFLSSIESRSKTNPTGWLHDSTVDMTTDAGRADWKARMLARADKSVSVAKEMGCQGVIVWDIEGQRNPHAISYIGDPRLMPVISPEMDPVADAFFKKFTDAGLRCGVTIRPTHVVRTYGGKNAWEHINVEDIVAELAGKIAYAKKRWGCTLFYTDSTVRWDQTADGEFSLHTLPAEFFQSLHRQFPDVLIIPEESSTRHHAYTAPYHEIMPPHNYTRTPADVRAVYPDAFSVIRVADAPLIQKDFDALVEAVRGGDIIMFRTWLDDPDNVPVKQILAKAAAR